MKIATIVNLGHTSGRDFMSGVFQYASSKPDWQTIIIQADLLGEAQTLAMLKRTDLAGIITCTLKHPKLATFLTASSVPLVVVGTRNNDLFARRKTMCFVTIDERKIGETGASYLLSLGRLRAYAFAASTEPEHNLLSSLRCEGFRTRLGDAAGRMFEITPPGDIGHPLPDELRRLDEQLLALPGLTGVMAATDKTGKLILDACSRLGIAVPERLAVIGVNNDEYDCLTARPTLSSIKQDFVQEGFTAAQSLDRLVNGSWRAGRSPKSIVISASCQIVDRDTTSFVPPGRHLVDRALQYIATYATQGISVSDVVSHLGVSRRLADLRFKEFANQTILHAIQTKQLEIVRRKLLTDSRPIAKISVDCGFPNTNYLKILFKARFGLSMREFRKRAKNEKTPSPLRYRQSQSN